jgi:prepilin-type N-terminal cleavage/methylation domain-containing protein
MGRFHHHPGPPPRGFSLLELLLALSLTVVVLVLVNMAVDLHLRSLDSRRAQLEEAQLARAILRMIAEDLRGAVQHHEQDMYGVQTLLQQSVSAGAASLGASAEAITSGGMPSDPSTGASPPADATLAAGSSAMAGGAPTTGTRDSSAPANTGNAGAAGEMSGAGSGSAMEPGANTADLAATTIPPVPGLFGNQF